MIINRDKSSCCFTKRKMSKVPTNLITKLRTAIRSNLSIPVYAHERSVIEVRMMILNKKYI